MCQNPICPSQVGTGGKKNDLKLWDLNRPDQAIFRAKNVCYSVFMKLTSSHPFHDFKHNTLNRLTLRRCLEPKHKIFQRFDAWCSCKISLLSLFFLIKVLDLL